MTPMDRVRAHPGVTLAYRDDDGFWAELKPGWACIYSNAHACHEDTARALLAAVNDVEPCNIPGCCQKEAP